LQTNRKPTPSAADRAEGKMFDSSGMIGAPRRIRTPDPQIRSLWKYVSLLFPRIPVHSKIFSIPMI